MPEGSREHEPATVWEAQDLYVIEGLSLERIAARSVASLATLKRWSVKYEWPRLREEYRRTESEIRQETMKARSKLIRDVVASGNPMSAFGFSALESAAAKAREVALKEREADAARAAEMSARAITTLAEAVAAMEEAVQLAINRMLVDPAGVSFERLRNLSSALDLLQDLRAKHAVEQKERKKGLSKDVESVLRDRLKGLA